MFLEPPLHGFHCHRAVSRNLAGAGIPGLGRASGVRGWIPIRQPRAKRPDFRGFGAAPALTAMNRKAPAAI